MIVGSGRFIENLDMLAGFSCLVTELLHVAHLP